MPVNVTGAILTSSGLCVQFGAPGANLAVAACAASSASQQFLLYPFGSTGGYRVATARDPLVCVDQFGASLGAGGAFGTYACHVTEAGGANQVFYPTASFDDGTIASVYGLRVEHSGQCMSVSGSKILQGPCDKSPSQSFTFPGLHAPSTAPAASHNAAAAPSTPAGASAGFNPPGSCTAAQTRIRMEWRDMTPAQQQAFINALNKVRSGGSTMKTPSAYHDLVQIHTNDASKIHSAVRNPRWQPIITHAYRNQPLFFPWHRKMLSRLEDLLRSYDPTVTLPYWDWSIDGPFPLQNPAAKYHITQIFSSSALAFGTAGTSKTPCVVDGFPAKYKDLSGACLTRGYTKNMQVPDYATVAMAVNQPDFRNLWETMESLHNGVHVALGGTAGDMSFVPLSSNDPLFYLHHANIDRIWDLWQQTFPASAYSYPSNINALMPTWNISPRSIFKYGDSGNCVIYRQSTMSQPILLTEAGNFRRRHYASTPHHHHHHNHTRYGSGRHNTTALPRTPELPDWYIDANHPERLEGREPSVEALEEHRRRVRRKEARI
ncbi:hypothetical protein HK101_003459, partial [Irineochytrium annulatum]